MENRLVDLLRMNPRGVILGALMAGAATIARDLAGQVVIEAYTRLKDMVIRRFGDKARVEAAVTAVEQRPSSPGRNEILEEELARANAEQDEELLRRAKAFLDLLKEQGLITGAFYEAAVSGSGAIAQGPGAVAAGAGGIAIGGDADDDILPGSAEEAPQE